MVNRIISKQVKRLLIVILAISTILGGFMPSSYVQAASEQINTTVKTLKLYETYPLTVRNTESTVTWTSSNANIAAVTKTGVVTGKNVGTATITAKTKVGKYICKITVLDEEISQALSLGIIPKEIQSSYQKTITYKQFCTMLGNVLKKKKASYVSPWQKVAKKAVASNKTMTRQEGMLALFYAAEIMGIDSNRRDWNNWGMQNSKIEQPWKDFIWDYPLFPDWKAKARYGEDWDTHMIAAYFFSFGVLDTYTGKTLFDYDKAKNSMRPASPFTCDEAIRAALRLYNVYSIDLKDRVADKWDKKILATAQEHKEAILNSETKVKYTGTAYYVSNSGDDSNDGLSPDTPWATLERINSTDLQKGDSLFFERGGLWRGRLQTSDGATYSAYGKGIKPRIYGSPENGADPEKWSLLEGTKNIWVFYKDMRDCGAIVFNDNESWAQKALAYWDGTGYVRMNDHGKTFDVKGLKNQSFFSALDLTGYTPPVYLYEYEFTGKLYLRCDAGNPGKVYNSIEFLSETRSSYFTKDCTIDNLCFMYGNNCGINSSDKNLTVQNCEVGWFGGCVLGYLKSGEIIRAGDGIAVSGSDVKVVNNYVHDIYDYGLTIETGHRDYYREGLIENVTFENNLVENCNGGMLIVNWEKTINKNHKFKNILMKGNEVLYSGYGWTFEPHMELGQLSMCNSMMFFNAPNYNEGIYITQNVFYLSRYSMVYCFIPRPYWPVFLGNTYVQSEGGYLLETDDCRLNISAYKKAIENMLGDKKAVNVPLGK